MHIWTEHLKFHCYCYACGVHERKITQCFFYFQLLAVSFCFYIAVCEIHKKKRARALKSISLLQQHTALNYMENFTQGYTVLETFDSAQLSFQLLFYIRFRTIWNEYSFHSDCLCRFLLFFFFFVFFSVFCVHCSIVNSFSFHE